MGTDKPEEDLANWYVIGGKSDTFWVLGVDKNNPSRVYWGKMNELGVKWIRVKVDEIYQECCSGSSHSCLNYPS